MEKKPVYCAHPKQMSFPSQDGHDFVCHVCGIHWPYEAPVDSLPKVQIGYTEAGEDGGRGE